jgi:hypothetical protein
MLSIFSNEKLLKAKHILRNPAEQQCAPPARRQHRPTESHHFPLNPPFSSVEESADQFSSMEENELTVQVYRL